MLENLIVHHGSPTLAGMKTGSMFTCTYQTEREVSDNIRELNHRLVRKGLRVLPLRFTGKRVLVYIYRPKQLKFDFARSEVRNLLAEYGYPFHRPERCIKYLMKRLKEEEAFPHEIGLFLGYPPEDVRGFIEHQAKCCQCVGFWKVYGNREAAENLFQRYRNCKQLYCRLWERNRNLDQLAVFA